MLSEIESALQNSQTVNYQIDVSHSPLDWKHNDAILFTGDNLTSLEKLRPKHKNTIDLCYLDPPY